MQFPMIFVALALVIGIVLGFVFDNTDDTTAMRTASFQDKDAKVAVAPAVPGTVNGTPDSAAIRDLQRRLDEEARARKALEKRLASLDKQVAALKQNPSVNTGPAAPNQNAEQIDNGEPTQPWFNEQALLQSGMESSQVNTLKVFFEDLEMERLYLRDQALREEWDNQRLREAMQELGKREDDLKLQLGDEAYDAYLYASGQPNRVEVTSVLASAPAGTAGIQAGDRIVRYDNQRIYTGFDLRNATTQGTANETVTVEVMRDGKALQFYLPRGPLGIRMESVSEEP